MTSSASRRLRRSSLAIVVALLATPAARGESATGATVLVVGASTAPLMGRLRAELEALGLRVVSADGHETTPAGLAERARTEGVPLALSVDETASGVELRLVDRVTGKTLFREILERDLSQSDPDSVVALRAVELLRASLLELELAHPPRGEVTPTPDLRQAARRGPVEPAPSAHPTPPLTPPTRVPNPTYRGSIRAGIGAAMHTHLGQTATVPGVTGTVSWQPVRRAAAGLWGTLPLRSATVRAEEGSADISSSAFGVNVRLVPWSPEATLEPSLGLGASVLWLNVEGVEAESDFVLDTAQLLAAGPHAELGCALQVLRGLTMRVDLRALVAFPRPIVEFVGREVVSLGRPFVTLSLGFEYRALLPASRD